MALEYDDLVEVEIQPALFTDKHGNAYSGDRLHLYGFSRCILVFDAILVSAQLYFARCASNRVPLAISRFLLIFP